MGKREVYRDEDFYLIKRDGFYHLIATHEGQRIRKSLRTKDLGEAKIRLESVKRECLSGWRSSYDDSDMDWRQVALAVHKRHRLSSVERNIPFDLDPAEVYELMHSTGFKCAVSGIAFSKTTVPGRWRDPWAPSLDRIENRHGYSIDNVRVVCLIANTAMNSWGYDTLLRLARGVARSAVVVANEETSTAHVQHAETHETSQVIDFKQLSK
ncbi:MULTISPECIES: hypothetical protein [unclassified Bradyrhizobium]|uniref:hypothetical protein n=2 Tax=Bradyrhizobium TaxID=374 RepID=UPI0028EAC4CB|nr:MULTISPECIES: hypothetical protein [unclassified Bradyrhizobium]